MIRNRPKTPDKVRGSVPEIIRNKIKLTVSYYYPVKRTTENCKYQGGCFNKDRLIFKYFSDYQIKKKNLNNHQDKDRQPVDKLRTQMTKSRYISKKDIR